MPGYYLTDENGNEYLNNTSVSGVSSIVMINGCENQDAAWQFMKWHSGTECQVEYSNEMVAILGPSAKHPTANLAALEGLPWSADELKEIKLQFNNLASIPNYPGTYIIDRYTNFAFLAAYNDGDDPVEELLSYITTINKEIARKRSEFDLETLDYVGQKLSEKRLGQALTLLSEGKLGIEIGVAQDDGEVVLQTIQYVISDSTKKQYASEFDTMISELFKAADTDNKISEEKQMSILESSIKTLEEIREGSKDTDGIDKAIELMNDALRALISYQER
jgi:hypothetical protein